MKKKYPTKTNKKINRRKNFIPTLIFNLFILFSSSSIFAQNIPLYSDTHFRAEQVFSEKTNYHITVKPFFVTDIFKYNNSLNLKNQNKSLNSILNSYLYSHNGLKLKIALTPIITSRVNANIKTKEISPDLQAGFSTFGNAFSEKLTFRANFFVAKSSFLAQIKPYDRQFSNTPYYGNYFSEKNGIYTFLSATGTLGYSPTNNFRFEIGHDKSFFGAGYRSLLLSDNTAPLPYLKTTVDIWKVKYVWLLLAGKDYSVDENLPSTQSYRKYSAMHYLSLNITKRININFFEAVIASSRDSIGYKGIEIAYLNPVIFYRPVEFATGTSANSLLGGGINIKLWKATFLYSQFILDEFILSHVKAQDGWWGNKQGFQMGFKSYNFLVKNLFAQGEINIVRPFTYSHETQNQNYGYQGQPLAHPLGANFAEATAIIRYNINRFEIKTKVTLARYGTDNSDTLSFGGDIYKSYVLRPGKEPYLGNSLFQGNTTNSAFAELKFAYLLNPKFRTRFEVGITYQKTASNLLNETNLFVFAGISTQIFNENY